MENKIKLEDFQIELQKAVSSSGVRFIHYKKPNAPIAITIGSRSGSRFDPKGKEGLAHFLEHMVFMGTEKFPNKKELSLVLGDTGSLYSAGTGTEAVKFEFTLARKEDLVLVADIIDQLINKPLLLDNRIESEKKVIITEITSKLDTNNRIISNNIKKLMFGDNPITNNFSGYEESVNKINRDDLEDYLKNTFPQDLVVVSCGGCDISDLMAVFSPILPYKPLINFQKAEVIQKSSHYGVTKMSDRKLLYGQLAFPTCSISSKDKLALNMLSSYLGGGKTSLFKEILRYDNGLLYAVSSGNSYYSDTGYFHVGFSLKKENLELVLNKIFEAIATLNEKGLPEDSLNLIKNRIVNSSTIHMQTVWAWMDYQFYKELLIKDNNYYYNDFLNDISNISKEDIVKVSKEYLTKKNSYLWIVGDIDISMLDTIFSSTS